VSKHTVRFTRNSDGWWTAEIPGDPGGVNCVTQGKSIRQARVRVREALAACLDDEKAAKEAELEEIIYAPKGLQRKVEQAIAQRDRLERLREESAAKMQEIVAELKDAGLTVRDIAEILGVSHQRVQQIAPE